jgi:hypothetical protein
LRRFTNIRYGCFDPHGEKERDVGRERKKGRKRERGVKEIRRFRGEEALFCKGTRGRLEQAEKSTFVK